MTWISNMDYTASVSGTVIEKRCTNNCECADCRQDRAQRRMRNNLPTEDTLRVRVVRRNRHERRRRAALERKKARAAERP